VADAEAWPALVRGLLDPAVYPHATAGIRVVETHISWVVLTGEFAYKIKKPVELGFLDFSTPELRRRYCEEELRVNRRTASDLYLAVVPIGAGPDGLRVGLEPAIEHAVKMRQFPHAARLDRCLRDGRLQRADLRRLGETLASFHASLPPRADIDPVSEVERVRRPARNNFVHLDPTALADETQQRLAVIEGWTRAEGARLAPVFGRRARQGAVREGHGDLHLENLLLLDERFVPFDAIEFNADLRWIDVANDIAFLVMDLMARQRRDFAHDVLSAWLEARGDYASLAVMRYYLVYRSMVRAVVTAIRGRQAGAQAAAGSVRMDTPRYVELAAELVDTPPPRLYLMHGLSGSGKTWLSERLVGALGALRIRSDLERKRPGLRLPAARARREEIGTGLYGPDATDRTYRSLAQACETGLRAGFDMIADAAFLERARRRRFVQLAESLGVPCTIIDCHSSPDQLRKRLRRRAAEQADASDADLAVLEHQLRTHEALDAAERQRAVAVDTGADALADVLRALAAAARRPRDPPSAPGGPAG
jgi:aminoglycoside phosphotransferase family enzyme/predicted kinase